MFSNFFSKIVPFMSYFGTIWYSVRWQYNTAQTHSMLDTWGYRHTLSIWNNYCFCTATVNMGTHLKFTFHIYCLSCWIREKLSLELSQAKQIKSYPHVFNVTLTAMDLFLLRVKIVRWPLSNVWDLGVSWRWLWCSCLFPIDSCSLAYTYRHFMG